MSKLFTNSFLISSIRKLRSQGRYSFPVDNLCIYISDALSGGEIFRCEMLVFILKTLERHFHELFHILFRCLKGAMIDLLEEIVIGIYSKKPGNAFRSLDHAELLDHIGRTITARKSLLTKMPFIEDLTKLNLRKATLRPGSGSIRSSYRAEHPRLNHAFISFHDHDYLDVRNFLKRIDNQGVAALKAEKTVSVFLAGEILSMPYETYDLTLKEFERGISLAEYYETMEKRGIFNPSYHIDLIAKLFESDVLY